MRQECQSLDQLAQAGNPAEADAGKGWKLMLLAEEEPAVQDQWDPISGRCPPGVSLRSFAHLLVRAGGI